MNKEYDMHHELPEAHEEWMELCALATTNILTAEERAQLEEHLAGCTQCQEVYRQYSALAHESLPTLAASYTPETAASSESKLWENGAARARLLAQADSVASTTVAQGQPRSRKKNSRVAALVIGSGIAAALVFALGLSGGYRLGKRFVSVRPTSSPVTNHPEIEAQKAALNLRLSDETNRLEELETSGAQEKREIARLQAELEAVDDESARSAKDKATEDQTLAVVLSDRDLLQNRLRDSQQNYEAAQQELVALRARRQQDLLHYASLELEVTDLNHSLHDAESRVSDDTQYLASDRDIRELMGARQLYIADVIDVDQNGDRRKPFGRVFYTRGKSLIFYAFDLDQQPGIRKASTFQAWAREGSDGSSAVSLGIFYIDSEANRRWALKASDPKLLAEINSVFVTVEPKGGSQKPTGKPLLHAYLRMEAPNHP